jgi:hypothetical protein
VERVLTHALDQSVPQRFVPRWRFRFEIARRRQKGLTRDSPNDLNMDEAASATLKFDFAGAPGRWRSGSAERKETL